MLGLTRIHATGSSEGRDHLGYLLATEYLVNEEGEEITASTWCGSLGAKLGLDAGQSANPEVMKLLAQGYGPKGKREKLAENAGPDHQVGFDMTFSPPKDVSELVALAMVEGDNARLAQLIEASQQAVEATLKQAEEWELIEVKRGKNGIHRHASEGLLASMHTHLANRNIEPDLHHHVLLYNVGFANGKFGGIETDALFHHRFALDKLYLAELVKNLQALGFGIEKKYGKDGFGNETGVDSFTVNGISEYLTLKHSTRRK